MDPTDTPMPDAAPSQPPLLPKPEPTSQPATPAALPQQALPTSSTQTPARASPARGTPVPPPPPQPNPHGSPTRVYLNSQVTPHLLEGVKYLAVYEPEKPLKWLAEFLAQKSREVEGA